MMNSVNDKSDNASQDWKRNTDGGDACSEEYNGTNVPSRAISTDYLSPGLGTPT